VPLRIFLQLAVTVTMTKIDLETLLFTNLKKNSKTRRHLIKNMDKDFVTFDTIHIVPLCNTELVNLGNGIQIVHYCVG
jgi:hypothetical protein